VGPRAGVKGWEKEKTFCPRLDSIPESPSLQRVAVPTEMCGLFFLATNWGRSKLSIFDKFREKTCSLCMSIDFYGLWCACDPYVYVGAELTVLFVIRDCSCSRQTGAAYILHLPVHRDEQNNKHGF
jgi:hypothetical protein